MNYIKSLQYQLQECKDSSNERQELINDFLRYLTSNKFWDDTSIQVSEVYDLLLKLRMKEK